LALCFPQLSAAPKPGVGGSTLNYELSNPPHAALGLDEKSCVAQDLELSADFVSDVAVVRVPIDLKFK
jgi:hypothetical protein